MERRDLCGEYRSLGLFVLATHVIDPITFSPTVGKFLTLDCVERIMQLFQGYHERKP
jgi:hypothetical protein